MRRKLKKTQGYLYLTPPETQGTVFLKSRGSETWQSLDPGLEGTGLRSSVAALASAGIENCFIFAGSGLSGEVYRRLPAWISELKMNYPKMDFHIRAQKPL